MSPLHINSPETSSESTKTPEVGGASAEEEDVEEVLEPGIMTEVKEVVEEDVIKPEAVEVVEITPVPTPVPEREETPQPEDKPLVEESTLVEDDPMPEEIPQVENDPQLEDSQESTNSEWQSEVVLRSRLVYWQCHLVLLVSACSLIILAGLFGNH